MALRYRRRQGRGDRAPDRPERAGGNRDLPDLCGGAAPLREPAARRQEARAVCGRVSQRSWQAERALLGSAAWRAEEPARRSAGGGRRSGAAEIRRRQAAAIPWLLLQDPDSTGGVGIRWCQELS